MPSALDNISLLTGDWSAEFGRLVSSAKVRLTLCSPFVSRDGAEAVTAARANKPSLSAKSLMLTNLSSHAVCAGAIDPEAVMNIATTLPRCEVVHLPRLHAKVYVADGRSAVITSGNLTAGGLGRNYECGVLVRDQLIAGRADRDIREYAALGASMEHEALSRYCDAAQDAREIYDKHIASASRTLQRRLEASLQAADEALLRARLGGGAIHTVFAKTIEYLLLKYGPLSTQRQHALIQKIHPDICDDSVDRVIDGQHFGKKWKHAVRTAQQQLRKRGVIVLDDGKWRVVGRYASR